jgi:osmoprotectant transport system permease protein
MGVHRTAPSPWAGAEVPTLFIAAAGILAALALPFARVHPSRIADGIPRFLAEVDPVAAAVIVLLWACAGAAAVVRLAKQYRALAAMLVSIIAPSAALVAAGVISGQLAGPDSIARVSVSTGFWMTMAAGYAAFVLASRKIQVRPVIFRRVLSLAVPAVLAVLLLSGVLNAVSVMREFAVQKEVFFAEAATHAALAGGAVLIGAVLGIAVGVLALRRALIKKVAFFVLNIVQTIPSLALFGLLILPLAALSSRFPILRVWGISGIGRAPALIALSFYAMLPIARNTYTALAQIPFSLRDAGAGMGMTRGQLLSRVEVPLALPLILAGVRTAAVQAVGNTVVTALIGAGGLGVFIFQGLGQYASDMILLGTLPVIAMAVLTDMLMGGLVRAITPKPLREAGT